MSTSLPTIGVVGAGVMGIGIAQIAALAGHPVRLLDAREGAAEAAIAKLGDTLAGLVAKGKLSSEVREQALARLGVARSPADLAECGCVIEAIVELLEPKRALLRELDAVLPPEAILASNTSSISITALANGLARPERLVGMHFFNPVPLMKLVEIIRGLATEDATYQAVEALAKRMGKAPVMAQDWPGFVVNRILCPMINEAIQALMEGVGDVAAIDAGMKLGANHPMGPLELADFVGLDTLYSVMKVLHEGLGDSKYRPSPLLAKYVEAGWYGRKSGRGFYDYSTTPPTPTR